MKKSLLMKSLLLLFALVVGTGSSWADSANFSHTDFTGQGASGSGGALTGATKGDITITGTGNGNSSYLQVYGSNSLIITPNSGATITKIELTATTSGYIKTWTASDNSTVTVSDKKATWSGSSTSAITLTNTASAQARLTAIAVTYTSADSRAATTVTISDNETTRYMDQSATTPTAVVKVSSTSASIDGASVTWSSTVSTVASIDETSGAITLHAPGTTTIKATYLGTTNEYKPSDASYTLTVYGVFSGINALQTAITSAPYNTGSGTKAKVTFTNAIVNYATTNYAYIIDENGYGAVINQNSHGLTAGKIINGTVTGATLCVYSTGATVLKNITSTTSGLTLTDGTVTTQTKTIDAVSEANQSMMVKFENVIYNAATSSFTDGTNTIAYVDYFTKNPTVADGGKYNVTGLLIMNDGVIKVAPISASGIVSTLINPTSNWKNGTEVLTTITIKKAEGTKKYTFDTNSDAGSITYSSSKTNVATIATDGTITPVGYGSTTITASTASTSNYNADEKSFTLTVSDAGLVFYESFDGLGASGNFNASNCDNTGWTSSGSAYQGSSAARLAKGDAKGSITTPALNIVSYGKIIITAKGWSSTEKGSLTLTGTNCTLKTTSISNIPSSGDDYEILFEVIGSDPKITMEAPGGNRTYIDQVSVLYADAKASVSSVRYATFCDGVDRDFSGTTIKVYKALATDYSVNLEEITDGIVPANTGVILFSESAQNDVAIPVATVAASGDFSDNDLIGINVTTKVAEAGDAGKTNYIFANGAKGVGFYKATAAGAKLGAHKAYLSTTATAATAREFLGFEGEVTAIESVEAQKNDDKFFNLAGQRVAKPAKGLYIVNGKKVIIK